MIDNLNISPQILNTKKEMPTINSGMPNSKLKEQTDAFESIMIKILMDSAMQNEKNIFSDVKDPGDDIYRSMYREELANASAGSFGFSQLLYDFLSRKI